MKDILIITSYFPPETGAASNRIFHLATGLKKKKFKISVVTPLPNYPTGRIFAPYRNKFKSSHIEKGIYIHRLWIYASISKNKLIRLVAMLSYSFSLICYFLFHKIPKTVIVQSPPLIVAFTCCVFLGSKNRKLILNVSDLWPSAGLELGAFKKNLSYRLLERIEKYNYQKADLILGQSNEIISHILTIFPKKAVFLYRNFPDFNDVPQLSKKTEESNSKIKMVYAGLLGIAQGVLKLCQNLNYKTIEFHIYGAGAEQEQIENYIKTHPQLPIFYHGEVTRQELHQKLATYDLGIIPLLNRIYGSVPSKIFEYAKLGLPMLYFGGGEGEQIIADYNLGFVVAPENYVQLNQKLALMNNLQFDERWRKQIKASAQLHFDFDKQLDELIKRI